MNKDNSGEIITGNETYSVIADKLINGKSVIIGWTDEGCDHRDILFTLKPYKEGTLQRGLNWNSHLYISIIDFSCMGFLLEHETDNRKHNDYIMEKLRLHDNHCDNKICELINGVIEYLDKEVE